MSYSFSILEYDNASFILSHCMKKYNFLLYFSLHIIKYWKNLRNNSHFARSSLRLEYLIMTPEAYAGHAMDAKFASKIRVEYVRTNVQRISYIYIEEND